jgi:hypothetical protein
VRGEAFCIGSTLIKASFEAPLKALFWCMTSTSSCITWHQCLLRPAVELYSFDVVFPIEALIAPLYSYTFSLKKNCLSSSRFRLLSRFCLAKSM